MGWVVYSDAVVRSSIAVLVFVVTASRYIGDAVSSHRREILEQCWCSKSNNVLGIAPMAIIDRQLPFEYTIASRSTGVMVMALPVLNINHSAFRSMFEKLFGSNINDLFYSPKMWNAVYDDHNEVACLMLRKEDGELIGTYVIKMKNYVEQLERLGYVLPQDLSVGLILNGLTSDFTGFVRNYNMHNTGKTIGKSLNVKRKGKGKDKSYISRLKNTKPSVKEHPTKDDICHHCKEVGHWKRNCPAYLAELIKKKKKVGIASSSNFYRGGEYISQEFKDYLKACGIVQQLTPLYTPQHNGVFERRNRTLLDMVRSMINLTTLLLSFWDYALETATHILNLIPTKKVDKTPYELWYGKVPNLSYLKDTQRKRWGNQWEGQELEEIQDEDTSPSENTSKIPMEVEGLEPPQEEVVPVRRPARTHQAPDRLCLNVEVEKHSLRDLNEPTNYKASLLALESDKWLGAINAEMQSMKDNKVWRLVDLPSNGKTVRSKWLFKKKTNMDGNVHTYKACLVAKGFTQTYGVDYEETFSPVTDIRAIRILIAIAAKVCKLQRFIYGLKQALRSWNKRFDDEIKKFRFAQNLDEPCVYQKASGSNVTFLVLYVDDIVIIENHIPSLQSVNSYLGKCFAMIDLGETSFILGIKIYQERSKRLIRLSQNAYMDKILKRFRMDTSKCGYILMQERLDLNKTQGATTPREVKRMQNVPYASVVGEPHWTAVKTILKYLRNTKDMFLVYGGNPEAEL
ncbi:retrovirus-related pol polyprotein from transposon TNT 1-94 [Tanacetum coccineum]